jgi:DNA-binding SARP family transcriptional activator
MPLPPPDTGGARAAARLRDLAPTLLAELPFGVLVADRDGAMGAWNAAARRLLGDDPQLADDGDPDVRCCDLFGCRSGVGPLADACITELALEADEVLPEVRVDVNGGAVWVTAATAHESQVVFQVRPANPRDRRRRTDPHWAAQPHLYVEVLGRTQVHSGETTLGGRWLAQRPGQLLKFMIASRGRPVHTEQIAYALWGASSEAPGNVRHHMHALRRRLEPRRPKRAPSQFVVTRGGGYQLDRAWVTIDADAFVELAQAGLDAAATGQHARARSRLADAARLYGGDFLADEPYAEWALDERDRLRELAARVLHVLADFDRAAGDLEAAYVHLRRLAELEPLDTHIQRELLEVCLRRGRRTEAARRYHALRMRTMRELGQEPGFSLADLADEVDAARPAGQARPTSRR